MRVPVIEICNDGAARYRGDFEFLELPRPGDRIILADIAPGMCELSVLYVRHHPSGPLPALGKTHSVPVSSGPTVEVIVAYERPLPDDWFSLPVRNP